MCGRFTLKTPINEIAELFDVDRIEESDLPSRFNIAPTQPIAAVRRASADGAREIALLRWGLVPAWAKDPSEWPSLINARAESLDRKPAFRDALRERRCLVVADGFFEWRAEGGGKQPYYVRLKSGRPFAFAALWDRWKGRGESVESCVVVTTDANERLRPIHDRMPVILPLEDVATWLDPGLQKYLELEPLLRPLPSDLLEVYPVTRQMNRPAFDEPACIEPLAEVASDMGAPESTNGEPDDSADESDQLHLL
jgi:putative SOS response-associated peptidase YedK